MRSDQSVDSRWWYWILAHPVGFVIGTPLIVLLGLLIAIPVVGLVADSGTAFGALWLLLLLLAGVFLTFVILMLMAVFVMLPFALYFDAKAIRDAPVDWNPDPLVYALLGALQFVVTPLVGLIVGSYYVYRRHVELGVP